ncbi:MAG: hypothetical protein RL291_529 [Pseudomonadota bacterium]
MASVTLTVNGRAFKLQCGDGEEHRLVTLAEDLQARVTKLSREFGAIGTDRLLLMAALMIGDELLETKAKLADAEARKFEDAFAEEVA